MSQADRYKALLEDYQYVQSKLFANKWMLTIDPSGWLIFKDGSKYNTANGGTINPGDIIV